MNINLRVRIRSVIYLLTCSLGGLLFTNKIGFAAMIMVAICGFTLHENKLNNFVKGKLSKINKIKIALFVTSAIALILIKTYFTKDSYLAQFEMVGLIGCFINEIKLNQYNIFKLAQQGDAPETGSSE